MSKPVLIAYGTRYGCTEEVSERIGTILKEKGLEVMRVNLVKTNKKEWPPVQDFSGIIVGSSIKGNRWTKEPQQFLKDHKKELKKLDGPLGIFICSLTAVTDYQKAFNLYIEKITKKIGVEPTLSEAFGGVLDFSETSHLGTFERTMMLAALKNIEKDMDVSLIPNGKNDLRNWEKIDSFARKFASLLDST
ncbi:MAG: hypothetical protein HXS53_00530 [Theionarchaea archaeon]|nr:hypothetical protein [Theionarchaea archaeon]